jgi:hypothetical protein
VNRCYGMQELRGYTARATDCDIGKVHGFYFDDRVWTIRYLVVDTGTWFAGRRVSLSTAALGKPEKESCVIPQSLCERPYWLLLKLTGSLDELAL